MHTSSEKNNQITSNTTCGINQDKKIITKANPINLTSNKGNFAAFHSNNMTFKPQKENKQEPVKYMSQSQPTKSNLETFPTSVEKMSLDKIKETYKHLHGYSKDLLSEKEVILESLRRETLSNEEQRNYIELLKQTIESAIVKNGLNNFLQSLRGNYAFKDLSNVDILMEISQIKAEADKHRKELVMAQVLIGELKQENDELKKSNEEAHLRQERFKENFESGVQELDQVKAQVKNLEIEKESVLMNYEEAKVDNKRLLEDLDDTKTLMRKYERELQENLKKINDFRVQLENHNAIETNLNEYKKSFDKLYQDFEALLKEKSNADLDLEQLREVNAEREEEIARLRNVIDEKENRYDNDKRKWFNENENLNRNNKKLERLVSELSNNLKERENSIRKLEDKLNSSEQNLIKTKTKLDECQLDNEEIKKASDRTIRELNSVNIELKDSVENLSNEKQTIYDDFVNLKAECEKLDSEVKKLRTDVNTKERAFNKLNSQYETLYKELNSLDDERNTIKKENEKLSSELRFWKDKYDKDINAKIGEINTLNQEIGVKNRNIEELNKDLDIIESELAAKEEMLSKFDKVIEENKNLRNELEGLRNRYEKVVRDLREENKKLSEEVKSWKEDACKLNDTNESVYREIRSKDHLLNNASFQVEALEERIVVISKEKQYLESLLIRVSKSHPDGDMYRLVNDIMNLNDSLAQLERDKLKVEDNIVQVEDKKDMSSSRSSFTKLDQSMRSGKDILKTLLYEYDRQIADKKQQIERFEEKIEAIEYQGKNFKNDLYESNLRIKQLESEIIEAKEELRKNRSLGFSRSINIKNDRYEDNAIYDYEEERIDTIGSNYYKLSPARFEEEKKINHSSSKCLYILMNIYLLLTIVVSNSKDMIYKRQVRNRSFNNTNLSSNDHY